MEIKEYQINEETARNAKMINSFSGYEKNEATNEYRDLLKRFAEDVEDLKQNAKIKITE